MPPPTASLNHVRALGAVTAVVSLGLGLGLQLLDRSPLIDVLGSMLYVIFFGLLVLLVWPALRAVVIASVAFAVTTLLELLQLTGIPDVIVAVLPPARLVFGSAFDPLDLLAYVVGALLLALLVVVIRRSARTETVAR
jgi:hypothetical protein